jgi:hypothetical protein
VTVAVVEPCRLDWNYLRKLVIANEQFAIYFAIYVAMRIAIKRIRRKIIGGISVTGQKDAVAMH